MLYVIYQEDGPDSKAIRAATKEAHFAYLDRHADILVLGGATLDEDGVTRTGSILPSLPRSTVSIGPKLPASSPRATSPAGPGPSPVRRKSASAVPTMRARSRPSATASSAPRSRIRPPGSQRMKPSEAAAGPPLRRARISVARLRMSSCAITRLSTRGGLSGSR